MGVASRCADGLHGSNDNGESTLRAQRIASRSINQSLALHTLGEIASVFVPIHARSLHAAAEATMFHSSAFPDRAMRPLHAHHAASLLASSVDTIVLPFRLRGGMVGGTYQSRSGGASGPVSTMRSLVRTIVPRPGMNVASLLSNFSLPRYVYISLDDPPSC